MVPFNRSIEFKDERRVSYLGYQWDTNTKEEKKDCSKELEEALSHPNETLDRLYLAHLMHTGKSFPWIFL